MVLCLLSLFSCLAMAAVTRCSSIDFLFFFFSLFVCAVANSWARSITFHSPGGDWADSVVSQPLPLTGASVKALPSLPVHVFSYAYLVVISENGGVPLVRDWLWMNDE